MILSKRTKHGIRIFFATLVGLIMMAPLLYMVSGSLMSNHQLEASTLPAVIPDSLHFENYAHVFTGPTRRSTSATSSTRSSSPSAPLGSSGRSASAAAW